jgi:hypothetical protein
MLHEATGKMPLAYTTQGQVLLCVPRSELKDGPAQFGRFQRLGTVPPQILGRIATPSDDWPYLYLAKKTVPVEYLYVIGSLMLLSIGTSVAVRGRVFDLGDAHFMFLGCGFLLLETMSITDCSLYFGATWLVTMLVIAGVLLMVLASNFVASRVRQYRVWMYLPLFAAVAVVYFTPREAILYQPFSLRLLWTLCVVPLPIFFAGLIFSTSFRTVADPAAAFGANLIGAMLGGFSEYLAMAIGNRHLTLLLVGMYLASMVCVTLARKSIAPHVG